VFEPATLVRRWWDVWRDGDFDALDEILGEKIVRHGSQGSIVRSLAQAKDDMVQYREAMEIATVRVDAQTVDRDTVWTRLTTTGVRMQTEETVVMTWIQACRIVDGRLVEMWLLYAPGVDWAKS
jgi:hypothetical protein